MKIISASRRTDIPAFYGEWFMNRIAEGFAGYTNPFNNKKNIVSLKKDDVASLVLWSKNFSPFLNNALLLKDKGYSLFFNYTITALPEIFEPGAPSINESIESLQYLSTIFTPDHINWRYDPILLSDITGADIHLHKFEALCSQLSGYIKRCYISFPTSYGKVERNFKIFTEKTGISIFSPDMPERIELANKIAEIADNYGITIYSCCGDYLTGHKIKKGHCIDREILSTISGKDLSKLKLRPTRKECGCTESTDIGVYNSCPHGCLYCYANHCRVRASSFYSRINSDKTLLESAFLGISKEMSDLWIKEIQQNSQSSGKEEIIQPELF